MDSASSGGDSGSGDTCTTNCPPPTIAVVSAQVNDERGDQISFASGDPVHTHAGPAVDLGGSGCPDIYMYPYLLGETAPTWGSEASPNPLAWQLRATAPAGLAGADYRVTDSNSNVLLDWTTATVDTSGKFIVALHRDGSHGIAQLGTTEGQLRLDVRAKDLQGQESDTSYCFGYHPLAAPLEVQTLSQDATADGLWSWTLAGDSPISNVIQTGNPPGVIVQRFLQHTAETIDLDLTFAQPAGQWAKTASLRFVQVASGTMDCGLTTDPMTDGRCSTLTNTTNSDTPSSGTLTSGLWTALLIDETTGQPTADCTVSNLHATCVIPPRAAGGAPHAYRLTVSVTDVTDLAPAATGPFSEYTVASRTYTGLPPVTVSKCIARVVNAQNHYVCSWRDYSRVLALGAASISFTPFSTVYQATVGESVPLAPLPYAPNGFTTTALTWDAGTDVLPGQ